MMADDGVVTVEDSKLILEDGELIAEDGLMLVDGGRLLEETDPVEEKTTLELGEEVARVDGEEMTVEELVRAAEDDRVVCWLTTVDGVMAGRDGGLAVDDGDGDGAGGGGVGVKTAVTTVTFPGTPFVARLTSCKAIGGGLTP